MALSKGRAKGGGGGGGAIDPPDSSKSFCTVPISC